MPVRKFINAPAARMMMRFHGALAVKERGSSLSPSSPSMAQYPPMGRSRIEYSVSPLPQCRSLGPIKIENSLTLTSNSFAARKCPNSWIKIKKLKIRIAMMINIE